MVATDCPVAASYTCLWGLTLLHRGWRSTTGGAGISVCGFSWLSRSPKDTRRGFAEGGGANESGDGDVTGKQSTMPGVS